MAGSEVAAKSESYPHSNRWNHLRSQCSGQRALDPGLLTVSAQQLVAEARCWLLVPLAFRLLATLREMGWDWERWWPQRSAAGWQLARLAVVPVPVLLAEAPASG